MGQLSIGATSDAMSPITSCNVVHTVVANCVQKVIGFALCLPDIKYVQRIGGLSPTVWRDAARADAVVKTRDLVGSCRVMVDLITIRLTSEE